MIPKITYETFEDQYKVIAHIEKPDGWSWNQFNKYVNELKDCATRGFNENGILEEEIVKILSDSIIAG